MLLQFLQLKQYHVIIIVVFHVVLHFFSFSGRMLLVLTITMLVLTLGSAQLTVNISSECQCEKKTLHQQFCDDHFGMYKTLVNVLSFFVINDGLFSMWFIKDKYKYFFSFKSNMC
jgi:ABC-type transport system involved in cytochrome bd biosynthesis fused ATPase/permease subunit